MTRCDRGMAALRAHLPPVHMRQIGGLAQTTLTTSSITGGSVKGRPYDIVTALQCALYVCPAGVALH